jgi:hypothetical protein
VLKYYNNNNNNNNNNNKSLFGDMMKHVFYIPPVLVVRWRSGSQTGAFDSGCSVSQVKEDRQDMQNPQET